MLLDIIAATILAGMMLVPIVNLIVGAIVGAGIAGVAGSVAGLAIAVAIMTAWSIFASRSPRAEVSPLPEVPEATANPAARVVRGQRPAIRVRGRMRFATFRQFPTVRFPGPFERPTLH